MIGCGCATCRSSDPRDKRLRPSIFIETSDARILVDAGPDLRMQALAHQIERVDAILFTHGHADHILGMDDIRRFNAIQRGAMPCYGDERTLHDIRRMFGYVFDPATPRGGGLPDLELFRILGPFSLGRTEVVPVPLCHGGRAVLGFRLGGFAYLTDCNYIPDESWPLLTGVELLVLDALREKGHSTHFSISEACAAARRIGAACTYFTHMCHDLQHAPTCERLPDGITLAYDGLTLVC